MATYGKSMAVTYVAWDTANNVGKTGDVANHTLRWIKDGTSAAPSNSPAEVDSTNAPGAYTVVLTPTEAQTPIGTLVGVSSTSGVSIMPVTIAFVHVPDADPDTAGGLPISDAGGLDLDTLLGRLDAAISSRSSHSAADVWSAANRVLTAGTNIVLAKGTGLTGLNDLDAGAMRTALGLAAANLDTQLGAVALEATLTAIKGTGWSTETLAAIKAAVDAITPLDAAGVRGAVGLASANLDDQLAALAAYVDTEVAAILEDTGTTIPGLIAALNNLSSAGAQAACAAALTAFGAALEASVQSVKSKTDNLPASPAAVGSAMTLTSGERDSVATALLDLVDAIATGYSMRRALKLIGAAAAGKISGAATATNTIRDLADGEDMIVATVDADGNRTAITHGGA